MRAEKTAGLIGLVCAMCATVLVAGTQGAMARARVTRIDVTNFGAAADDGASDTRAVIAALEETRRHRASVVVFPKGRYDFFGEDKPSGQGPLFEMKDLRNVTIDGGGSTFMFHSYNVGAFHFNGCSNVTVRNFTIDYVRPPYSLGRIVACDEKSFDVEVEKEYPVSGDEGAGAFLIWDREKGHPLERGMEYYGSIPTELVSPGVIRLKAGRDFKFDPGLWVLVRHRVYGAAGIVAGGCTDFCLDSVTMHLVPGMGFIAGRCTNVTVKGLRLVPRPGSGLPMTATADGMHMSGNKGLISIQDCEFEGMGDDAANIKTGLFSKITEKIDDHTVLSQHNLKMVDPPSPGDVVELSHHPEMVTYGTAIAESVEVLADGVMKTRFRDPLPAETRVGDLIGNSTRVAKVRIKNVSVRNNRARGFLLQNRDVVVENCRFTNCTSGGIWVLTEVWYFYESIGSRDVVVRNCIFENCGYWPGPGALAAMGWTGPEEFTTTAGVHKGVVFERNIIRGTDNSGIFAAGVDGLTIRGNSIEQACRNPNYKGGDCAIYVMGSRDVSIENNTCLQEQQGAGCKSVFEAGPGCNRYAVKLRNNVGF